MTVVLITGGTQGIGKATAMAFARQQATVVLNYHSNDLEAQKAVDEIYAATKIHVELIKADVTDESQVTQMINQVISWFGQIDILINNAGIFKDSVIWKMDKTAWDAVINTNLTGTFLCTKHVLPYMREKRRGRIINISSVVGQTGAFGTCNYAASKAGIIGFTKAIAREVALFGITVNCVALGYIDIGMGLRISDKIREKIITQIPMQRFGTAEEVVATITFISSNDASYITGQVIAVNGGYYL